MHDSADRSSMEAARAWGGTGLIRCRLADASGKPSPSQPGGGFLPGPDEERGEGAGSRRRRVHSPCDSNNKVAKRGNDRLTTLP
jgi:hypothetical protein